MKNVIGRIGTKIDRNSGNEIFSTHPFPIAAAAIASPLSKSNQPSSKANSNEKPLSSLGLDPKYFSPTVKGPTKNLHAENPDVSNSSALGRDYLNDLMK